MTQPAELAVVLKARDQASRVMKDVGDSGTKMGDALKAGAAIAAAGLAAMAGAATVAVKMASDMSEAQNKVSVVFGDSADAIFAFASTSAQSLGVSTTAALTAAGTFGNLFVAMGIAKPTAAAMSTSLLTLAADLASFNNMDPTEVLDKLRAGLVGEAEPLRALGVNLTAATIATRAMELGLAPLKGELSASAKAQAAYSLILEQTKTAQGDFANTSTGMANSIRIINASFDSIVAELGGNLLPIVQPVISAFATGLPVAFGLAKAAAHALATGSGFDILFDHINKVFGSETGAKIAAIIEFLIDVKSKVEDLADRALPPLRDGFDVLTNDVLPAVATGLRTLVDMGSDIIKFFKENELAVDAVKAALVTLVSFGIANLLLALPGMIAAIVASTLAFGAQAVAAGAAAAAVVLAALPFVALGVVIAAVILAGLQIVKNWELITFVAQTMATLVGMAFLEMGTKIRETLDMFLDIGRSIVDGLLSGVREKWDGLVNNVMGLIRKLPEGVRKFLGISSPSRLFAEIGAQITLGIAAGISAEATAVRDALKGLFAPDQMDQVVATAVRNMELSLAAAQTAAGATSAARNVREKAQRQALIDAFAATAATPGDEFAEGGLAVLEAIAKKFGVHAAEIVNMAVASGRDVARSIRLATGFETTEFSHGGIVPGPIGAPVLATVHGGETITPAGRAAPSVTIVIQGNVYGDAEFERRVAGAVTKAFRSGGLGFLGA